MVVGCPKCSRLYSPRDLGYGPGDSIPCECGATVPVPEEPEERPEPRLRSILGERLVYGVLAGCSLGFSLARWSGDWLGGRWDLRVLFGFGVGFLIGAVAGPALLDALIGGR